MKAVGWIISIIILLIVAMIVITVFSQFDLLQARINKGIGSTSDSSDLLR